MFGGRQDQDVITVLMKTGERYTGSYMTQAGMHFVGTKVGKGDLIGKVEGPIDPDEVERVEVLKSRGEVLSDRRDRALGERLPGREPVTREDFEYRLERLAKGMAVEEGMRRTQLSRQFNELADRISLAKPKRAWLIAAAHWSLRSNEPPRLADLWSADVASPSLIRRPSPKDFDPDPVVRKSRDRLPEGIAADPQSVPNLLRRLRAAGLKATISLAGDPPWERAIIQVDLSTGRSGRFSVDGRRVDGEMRWVLKWAGNDSNAGRRHHHRALGLESYAVLKAVVNGDGFHSIASRRHTAPRF
ncbi:hypothetical protein GOB57_22275 [Sinorhizobium meliloti]|nr:hypothetical protein [Sinorhizobium meliloti]